MLPPVLLTALLLLKGSDTPSSRTIPVGEAKHLLHAALPAFTDRLPGLGIEPGKLEGRFYFFTITWAAPANSSSVVAGNYAVDSKTGDVFSAVIGCDELSTPALRDIQKRVRSEIGLSPGEYRRIKTHGPLCDQ